MWPLSRGNELLIHTAQRAPQLPDLAVPERVNKPASDTRAPHMMIHPHRITQTRLKNQHACPGFLTIRDVNDHLKPVWEAVLIALPRTRNATTRINHDW